MAKQEIKLLQLGGVDSRSNPLAMPPSRALRCLNWRPTPDGHPELREGYALALATGSAVQPHSLQGFRTTSGGKYIVFWQGTTPKLWNLVTGAITTPVVKGKAVSSQERFSYYLSNTRLHAVNGTDYKYLHPSDLVWRDIGIREFTASEASSVVVAQGDPDANAIPQSTVGGAQPGYQFYMCLARIIDGVVEHVGNRIAIGSRLLWTDQPRDVVISNLPNLVNDDSELVVLIGRTGDGGQVPYTVVNSSYVWITVPHGTTSITIMQKLIDGNCELPVDNYPPPNNLFAVSQVGDRTYGLTRNAPWVYETRSKADLTSGDFVGMPEQAWTRMPETFPTCDNATGISSYAGDCVVGSLGDTAVLTNPLNTGAGWKGPWIKGWIGAFAGTIAWQGLPFWISPDLQLCSLVNVGPLSLSGEYETALLSGIAADGRAYVETVYESIPSKKIERLRIHFTGEDGKEHHVFHDFGLRDTSDQSGLGYSPYFAYQQLGLGQGYEAQYEGILSQPHTICGARDKDGNLRTYVGAADGNIYVLDEGCNDNGTEFVADRIGLLNFGDNRPLVGPFFYFGDENVQWSICREMGLADPLYETNFEQMTQQEVPNDEHNNHFQILLNAPEMVRAFVRIKLQSHSADAPAYGMGLNDPPHCPLESYGRVWAMGADIGEVRGK